MSYRVNPDGHVWKHETLTTQFYMEGSPELRESMLPRIGQLLLLNLAKEIASAELAPDTAGLLFEVRVTEVVKVEPHA